MGDLDRRFFLFDRWDSAAAFRDAVDNATSLPAPGVNVGGGVHAPADETWTVTWALVLKHPTRNLWAYPFEAQFQQQLTTVGLPQQSNGQALNPGRTGSKELLPNLDRLPARIRSLYQNRYAHQIAVSDRAFFDLDSTEHQSVLAVSQLVEKQ